MLITGIVFGVIAAVGQGYGAVLSRKAYQVAAAAGEHIDGLTAAYQRILAGWVVAAASMAFVKPGEISQHDAMDFGARRGVCGAMVAVKCLAGPPWRWLLSMGACTRRRRCPPIVAMHRSSVFRSLDHGRRAASTAFVAGGAIAVAGAVAPAGEPNCPGHAMSAWLLIRSGEAAMASGRTVPLEDSVAFS